MTLAHRLQQRRHPATPPDHLLLQPAAWTTAPLSLQLRT